MKIEDIAKTINEDVNITETGFSHSPVPIKPPVGDPKAIIKDFQNKLYEIQQEIISHVEAWPDDALTQEEWDVINAQNKANAHAKFLFN